MKKYDGRASRNVKKKLWLVMGVILAMFALVAGRLIYWNVSKGHEFEKKVLTQQRYSSTELPFERGDIYDSTGKLIATNERLYHLILEPKNILLKDKNDEYKPNMEATVSALVNYMGLDRDELVETLEANKDSYYLVYDKDLPDDSDGRSYDDISAMKEFMDKARDKKAEAESQAEKNLIAQAELITGVRFEEEYQRVYPNGSTACHLIGFTVAGNLGQWGIEQQYNEELNGVDGKSYSYLDENLNVETTRIEPINGNSLVTTIHLEVQKALESNRRAFEQETGAKNVTITAMDPRNGEILGMPSTYDYDLNNPMDETVLRQKYSEADIAVFKENQKKVEAGEQLDRKSASEILTTIDAFSSIWKNSVISDTYEPGSTFKPFTVATSLAEDLYDGDEYFYCPGYYTVGNTKIGCSHEHDSISFSDIVAQSCNTALMQIGLKEGYETFTAYQKLFGFGQKTGIDLPGETDTSTLVYSPENMKDVDLATNSFGQNFNVSALQLITAFCSVVNGGYYYQPHVVKQIIGADGNVVKNIDKTLMRTTISNEVSERMREYLKETVLTGTGKTAAIEGYSIGGKTGTAEKYSPVVREDGKVVYIRNKTDYLVSFIACTPAENPEVVIYVTIDEPHVEFQANSGLATRLEKACMEDVEKILGIKKTETTATAE